MTVTLQLDPAGLAAAAAAHAHAMRYDPLSGEPQDWATRVAAATVRAYLESAPSLLDDETLASAHHARLTAERDQALARVARYETLLRQLGGAIREAGG